MIQRGVRPREGFVKVDILKKLLAAHAARDDAAFRKAAIQLASSESEAGHIRVAEQLRREIAKIPAEAENRPSTLDISTPRGDIADLLDGGHRDERLGDIILSEELRERLTRVLRENRLRTELEAHGVRASRRLLFYGPPGNGKSLAASVVAGELGLPLMTVRFDGLFSRFLGATAGHLKTIFDEMPRRPAIYLFDEFDAVGKRRGDLQDVGEIGRVVTSFLQLLDRDTSRSVVIAATNHEALLDPAIFRRFDDVLHFKRPDSNERVKLCRLRLSRLVDDKRNLVRLGRESKGLAFSDLARVCDDAIKDMVLDDRSSVEWADLQSALGLAQGRLVLGTND